MSGTEIDLNRVLTADEFIAFMAPEVQVEAVYTETSNEGLTLGDYLSDLHRRLTRMLGEDA